MYVCMYVHIHVCTVHTMLYAVWYSMHACTDSQNYRVIDRPRPKLASLGINQVAGLDAGAESMSSMFSATRGFMYILCMI